MGDEGRQPVGGETGGVGPFGPHYLFAVLILLGVSGFLWCVSGDQAQRAWQAYLINFVFWTGLSFGSVVFVAVLNMTNAHWARPMKRLAEAPAALLPVLFVLFWVLYLGREWIFPWIREPAHGKEWWLNVDFLFARNGLGLLLLTAAAVGLVVHSVRSDVEMASAGRVEGLPRQTPPTENPRWRSQVVLSPILTILYALVLSLLAFDLIMSLDPHWLSTLFGAYYFIGSLYTGLAGLMFMTALLWQREGLAGFIQREHFHDLGKLLLAFCLVTGDFFYSQFFVIWYGNLPEETRYVILRVREAPWYPVAWAVLVACFALPFVVLLSRKVKTKPAAMMALSGLILVGMWLERFLLVAPSLWKGQELPLGLPEIAITAGFLGAMGVSVQWFLAKVPPLPVSDPLFRRSLAEGKER